MGRRAAEAVRLIEEYDGVDADAWYEDDGPTEECYRMVSIPELLAQCALPLNVMFVVEHAVANGAALRMGPYWGRSHPWKSVMLAWPPSAAATHHRVAYETIAGLLNAIATSRCCELVRCFGYEVWFVIEAA